MRRGSVVALVVLVGACSSGTPRTEPAPTTTTVRAIRVTESTVSPRPTTTTRAATTGHFFGFGSFSRTGPWSVQLTDTNVTPHAVIPYRRRDYRSFDGRSWTKLPPAPGMPRFVDDLHGWVLGRDPEQFDRWLLWSTSDGGLHYTDLGAVLGPLMHAGDVGEIDFVDDTHGFLWTSTLVASGWSVRRTTDGGRTWQDRSSSDAAGTFFGPPAEFDFVSATEGYASGYTFGRPGDSADLFRTIDAGSTWHRIGPEISGQHGAGLPTIIDDFLLVPIFRVGPSGRRVELYEGRRHDVEHPWRLVWSVEIPGRGPVHWPTPMQPDAALIDENDGVVSLWQTFTGVRRDQRVDRASPSKSVRSVSANASLLFAASDTDGVFVSSDIGETWQRIDLPSE